MFHGQIVGHAHKRSERCHRVGGESKLECPGDAIPLFELRIGGIGLHDYGGCLMFENEGKDHVGIVSLVLMRVGHAVSAGHDPQQGLPGARFQIAVDEFNASRLDEPCLSYPHRGLPRHAGRARTFLQGARPAPASLLAMLTPGGCPWQDGTRAVVARRRAGRANDVAGPSEPAGTHSPLPVLGEAGNLHLASRLVRRRIDSGG
jgi:hypothetical protein